MNKQLTNKGNEDKKQYIVSTLTSKYGNREDITLKQSHDNDFDLKLGSRSIVRIVANKKQESNGVALFSVCKEALQDIRKFDIVKDSILVYNIEEIGKVESCFFRFNFETIASCVSLAIQIFDSMEKLITAKKEASKEAEKSKKQEASKGSKKKA